MRSAAPAVLLVVLLPATGVTEDRTPPVEARFTPLVTGNRVWLDLEALPTTDANLFIFALEGQFQVHRNVVVFFDAPGVTGMVVGESHPAVAPGNVTVGIRGIGAVREDLVLWGSLALSVPTTWSVPRTMDGLAKANIDGLAALGRGIYEPQRFVPEMIALHPDFGLEITFSRRWRYRFEAGTYLGTSVGPIHLSPGSSPTQLPVNYSDYFQSSSEFQADFGARVYVGLRLQLVISFAGAGAGVFIGYQPPGTPLQLRLDWLNSTVLAEPTVWDTGYTSTIALQVGYAF